MNNAGEVGTAEVGHLGILNFHVNSGVVYDEEDPIKLIRQLETKLQLCSEKHPTVTILMGIAMNLEDFEQPDIRGAVNALIDEDEYQWFPKNTLVRSLDTPEDAQNWVPQTKASIERDLFPNTADVLLVKLISPQLEEEEAGAEE